MTEEDTSSTLTNSLPQNATLATRMATPLIGSVKEFNDEAESWIEYMEQVEHFFIANEITDEGKKKSVLLSSCGAKTYRLFRNLLAPVKPGDSSWETLTRVMKEHHHPKPSIISERFKFNKRDRKPGESVPNYLAELRKLAEHCEFENVLDDMLRDRLVCGIQDVKMQEKLLSVEGLTLDRAFKITSSMERAHNESNQILSEPKDANLHKVNYEKSFNKSKTEKKPCYRCGGNHGEHKCNFKTAECYRCKKVGHIAKVCLSSKKMAPIKKTIAETEQEEKRDDEITDESLQGDIKTIYQLGYKSKPINDDTTDESLQGDFKTIYQLEG